ncbi:PhnD/SsuA/transferrin family substrate-binding protein [Vreelandella massiliensis]|uniref:PhnD/SsuA/transferrin family substrate-binding protein n=1 Tax=Vreelandella massiliensis TaxID=1816686 RepID=UPI0013564EC8|nr:PhnD/SsuA/transferrin family substrate-binding protein [Halomonas massiliensis]
MLLCTRRTGPSRLLLLVSLWLLSLWLPSASALATPTTTLGVFAYRDAETVRERFAPVVEAMQWALPGHQVEMRVLSLDALDAAIEASEIDFILTNPRHFLAVRQRQAVTGALASLQTQYSGRMLSSLAGVILTRPDAHITTLDALEGRQIGVPGKRFLGGFLAQAYEIYRHGENPERFAEYIELGSHDAVMEALLAGELDVGFVRSGILESWRQQGRVERGGLKVLSIQSNERFPLAHSTRLYPEWAFAAMMDVPTEDVRRVTQALLGLKSEPVRFDPPHDYLSVEMAARALGVAPFERESFWEQLRYEFGPLLWLVLGLAAALLAAMATLAWLYFRQRRLYKRVKALFHYSPSPKLLLHPEGGTLVIDDANQEAVNLFGMASRERLVGHSVIDLSPATQPDGEPSQVKVRALMSPSHPERQTFHWTHLTAQGETLLTEATLMRLSDVAAWRKKAVYIVALRDITQQARFEAQLVEERNALKNILWGTAAGTWEWNVQTGETRFNERWAEMVGYRLEELAPTTIDTWMTFCHPEDLKRSEAMLAEHFAGKRDAYDIEARMRHREGHWIWVQDRGRVISRTEAGEPLWVAGTHTDITARKEAEARVSAMVAQMQKHAALLPGMLYQYWYHPDGRSAFPYASEGIEEIYGLTPEQVREDASAVYTLIDPTDVEAVTRSIERSAATLSPWRATYRVNHPAGYQLWVEGIATPERLEDGSTMWHGYLRDVTDEHTTQLQLEQYRESLERSNQELEHFAYAASHDLRQPLRMVTSYAQLLERHLSGQLDDDGKTMLHYMRDGAQRMDSMLLSLLDYSRVGRKGQPMQAMKLKDALDEALHFLTPTIQEADATITVEGEWPQVFASPDEMMRLFQNLLSNAVKYRSPDKATAVNIRIEPAPSQAHWQVSVCDNGIGIAPEQIDRLFKVFQRLHTREQYEGSGVGLAVCRKIVERHGGRIWIESEGEGKGSCFVFTLPMTPTAEEATP